MSLCSSGLRLLIANANARATDLEKRITEMEWLSRERPVKKKKVSIKTNSSSLEIIISFSSHALQATRRR
jgi:hypothetical protein